MPSHNSILIATTNNGKLREIQRLFANTRNIDLKSLRDLPNIEVPEENGLDFAMNAELKARYYATKSGCVTMADDSGLSIPALGGLPGIYSARWASDSGDFSIAINRIYNELLAIGCDPVNQNIDASFCCALAIYNPISNELTTSFGEIHGSLTFPPRGDSGFGYDPIFIPNGQKQSFSELSSELKERFSHRTLAFNRLGL